MTYGEHMQGCVKGEKDIIDVYKRQVLNEPLYPYVARQHVERSVLYMQTEDMSLQNLIGLVGYDNP